MTRSEIAAFPGRPQTLVEHQLPGGATIIVLPTEGPRRAPDGGKRRRQGTKAAGPATPSAGVLGSGVVALQLWVLSGTAAEGPREHGCAHLLEHMLFKPIVLPGQTAPVDIATRLEALGGDVNAFTSHDETVFHATVPVAATHEAIEALLPAIVAPQIDPEALAREAEVVVEEISQYYDDPGSRLLQDVMAGLFGTHAYGRPVLGTAQGVRACSAARLAKFHARAYGADRVRLIVVGAVDPADVIRTATRWMSQLPKARRRPVEAAAVAPTRPFLLLRRDEVLEAHLELAWSAPALPAPDAVALEVASVVLGYGEAARLSVDTRRREQAVSDAHASFFGSRLGSTFLVTARMRGRQAAQAVAALAEQVDRLRSSVVDDEELARAQAVLRSDLVYRRETTQGQAHALGYYLSLAGDLDADRRYYEALSQVTAPQVRDACARFLAPAAAAVGLVVPQREVSAKKAVTLRRQVAAALRPAKRKASPRAPKLRERAGVSWVDLPCGVRLRAVLDPRVPIVGGWLAWPGGLRLEDARRHGAAPIMAELLTRGCEAVDGDDLAREIDGKAAVLDGFSGRNSAGLHLECMAPDLLAVLRRALQCATAPSFTPEELDEERRVALADFESEDDDLAKVAIRDALGRLYAGHPFGLRRRGTPKTLERLTAVGLRRRWQRDYPLPRMVLGLAGDVDLDAVVALVETMVSQAAVPRPVAPFPAWPGAGLQPDRVWPAGSERRIMRAKEQAHIALAYPGLAVGDPRAPALEVLMAVLGGQAGRLFLKLREEEGLVYHVSAQASEGIDAGDVLLYAATGQDKVARARAAMEAELAGIAAQGITATELRRAKAWLAGQHDASLERRGRVASMVAFDEIFGRPVGECVGYPARIERVTAAAVVRVARALLDPSRQISTIVSA